MQLTNPIWLWGLTGLIIPIGIHLLSRKEGKVIRFGSLRHLEESQTKQSINIKLNEVALLSVRCALIVSIVILLSGLDVNLFDSRKSRWVVLEDGLEHDPGIVSLLDSLTKNGFEVKSMTKGFPNSTARKTEPFVSYWEMIEQLPLRSLNNVIIVSYSLSSKFKGKRIALPSNVTWIAKEPREKEFLLSRVTFSKDSVLVRKGKSSSLQTSFVSELSSENTEYSALESVSQTSPDTISVNIFADRDFEYDRKIVLASLRAIETTIPVIFKIRSGATKDYGADSESDWIIWLSKSVPPNGSLNTNSLVFMDEQNNNAALLTRPSDPSQKDKWIITKRLNEETALKEQFTLTLSSILINNERVEARADSLSQTTEPEQSLWSRNEGRVSSSTAQVSNDKTMLLLIMVILVLLIAERFLAFKRNA